ncbi:hypothetical protein EYC84_006869 [Monilinia fructicola]|uniref:Uncharacterized protein n=1 Tax=Monilinia fructicola TaxID=38448 RepID=A0A5M9K4S3_MONFR|nr:hypothetical protein EYC84_006869 [Monilinia fructicola]
MESSMNFVLEERCCTDTPSNAPYIDNQPAAKGRSLRNLSKVSCELQIYYYYYFLFLLTLYTFLNIGNLLFFPRLFHLRTLDLLPGSVIAL